jgi:hypothetical protein
LAQLVAEYWARVSAEPAVDVEAQEVVLRAVHAQGLRISTIMAEVLGEAVVSEAEVRGALKHAPSGKAPGVDGLPVEFYRRLGDTCIPLLARVFSAIGKCGRTPAGFLAGAITSVHKANARDVLGNYRPITLLDTDYRLLAKILAFRLKLVQGAIVGPEQTAFLPGRHIGDNIMLLQLMPHALPQDSESVVVFCDFRKAYDTVSRAFLFRLLGAAGVGAHFLQWVLVS